MSKRSFCTACGAAYGEGGPPRRCAACGGVDYENPVPVVCAVVLHEGDVVLVRKAEWPEKMFALVAGFVEHAEAPEAAMAREIQEELGLRAVSIELLDVGIFAVRNELLIGYQVVAEGEIKLDGELAAWKKIAPDKLRSWPFGTGFVVDRYLERRQVAENP